MNRQLHQRTNRRRFVQGAAAGAAAVGASWLPTRTDRIRAMQDTFDWKQFDGGQVRLILNKHPYTESLLPLIPEFTELTGITVPEPLILPEAEFFQKLRARSLNRRRRVRRLHDRPVPCTGPTTSAGWTEPLEPFLADPNMTSPDYDAADIFEGADGRQPLGSDAWRRHRPGQPVGHPGHGRDLRPVLPQGYLRRARHRAGRRPSSSGARTTARPPAATSRASSSAASEDGGMTGTGFISTVPRLRRRGLRRRTRLPDQLAGRRSTSPSEYCASVQGVRARGLGECDLVRGAGELRQRQLRPVHGLRLLQRPLRGSGQVPGRGQGRAWRSARTPKTTTPSARCGPGRWR